MAARPFLFLCIAAFFVCFVAASSQARNPLQFLAKVEQPRILKPRNKVHAFSSFDLSFHLYKSARRIRLSLEPNYDILPTNAAVTYLGPDGRVAHSEPIVRTDHKVYKGTAFSQDNDGSWLRVGWARVTVHRDGPNPLFEGAFTVNHDHHHIQLPSTYTHTKHSFDPNLESADDEFMLLYRDSDISSHPNGPARPHHGLAERDDGAEGCSADKLMFNRRPDHPVFRNMLQSADSSWGAMSFWNTIGRRQIDSLPGAGNAGVLNLTSSIGQTAGCPTTKKVALVGVATDCGYTGDFATNQTLRRNVIKVMNMASSVWEDTFNISLGLQDLYISPKQCPGGVQEATPWNRDCQPRDGLTMQSRLNLFSAWRGNLGDTNSHWTLMTKCQQGGEVGLAWLGQACVQQANVEQISGGGSETVSGANVVARTGTEWQVVAHETGHTFGAVHDCDDATCAEVEYSQSGQCCPFSATSCSAGSQYIMNPFTASGQNAFSPCTVGNICGAIGRKSVNTDCLADNKGITTITGHQCGNGIVEQGEECDCGGVEGCADDPCCNPQTCKYINGAVCDDANEDCCVNCQFASKSTVCRPSSGTCDPEERCSGKNAVCPEDVTAPDGQQCSIKDAPAGAGDLACASGQCTSRNYQCQTVMGSFTRKSNETYACDDSTCTLTCGSPLFGTGVCYSVPQNMLDGTPCGGGGHCRNGQCKGSQFGKEIVGWIKDHKPVVIGVSVAVGVLLLIVVGSCISGCVRRRRRQKQLAKLQPPPQASPAGWYGPPPFAPGPWRAGPGVDPNNPSFYQGQAQDSHHTSQQGWRPPQSPPPAGSLYGGGIIGSRGVAPLQPLYPSPPPPSHFTGAAQSSPRYA